MQLVLTKTSGWGGRRAGAGRKRNPKRRSVDHLTRARVTRHTPVHVTMRVLPEVWTLRTKRAFRVLRSAMSAASDRLGLRLCDFSVQGNHLHLVVEAENTRSLSRGMQGLSVRIARALNRLMGRRGKVLADRFHSHVLRTPREVAHALHYVRYNDDKHRLRRGHVVISIPDEYSSIHPFHEVALAAARSYLLQQAHLQQGPPPVLPDW